MGGNESTVLVIGQNIERQIIEFDEHEVLRDEQDRAWLDIKFDNYFLRANSLRREFSQLTYLERTLRFIKFQVQTPAAVQNFALRVVLKCGDDYKIIRAKEFDDHLWSEPKIEPAVIVLLDSANLSLTALQSLMQYLKEHPAVKLVVEYRNDLFKNEAGRQLLRQAVLVWADLRSRQIAEADDLIERFKFDQQILLINHQTGLSLSDKQRTYRLTSIDYLTLNPLEWLGIAIKTLQFGFDIEDKLKIIGQIGVTVARQDRFNANNITKEFNEAQNSINIELIRGEINSDKILSKTAKEAFTDGLVVDLTAEKLPVIHEILQVHDLKSQVGSVILNLKHFEELMKRDLRTITSLKKMIKIGVEIPSQKRTLANRPHEMVDFVGNDVGFLLDEVKFYHLPMAKFTAEFLLGRDLPSEAVMLANVRQLASFAAQAKKRQIVPLLTVRGVTQANFELRRGALALEFARILRCLEIEFRALDLKFDQAMIDLEITSAGYGALSGDMFPEQCQSISDYLHDHDINCRYLLYSGELSQTDFVSAHHKRRDLICNNYSFDQVTNLPRENNQLRIKFSQFLASLISDN